MSEVDPVYQQHSDMKQLSKINMHKRTYLKKIMTTIGKLREIDDIDKYEQVINILTSILNDYNEQQKVLSSKMKSLYKHIHYIEKV